jgi:hypothetical protein
MWWHFYTDLASANLEAQRVIALRLVKLAHGGPAAEREARRMVSEKIVANAEAATTLATGGSVSKVLRRYRTIMRANTKRMSKPKRRR